MSQLEYEMMNVFRKLSERNQIKVISYAEDKAKTDYCAGIEEMTKAKRAFIKLSPRKITNE